MKTIFAEMRNWRRDIHKHPELGFDETRTSDKIAELLSDFGVEVHMGIGGTGVVGVLKRGTSEKAIGLRADMDALPIEEKGEHEHTSINKGVFHGCGHDGHSAMLLGAAKYLSEKCDFDGTVYFIFQPSEENGLGALAMMSDGLFDQFPMSAIYGLHNMPGIKKGQMMTSEDNFVIELSGLGGHSSMPNKCRDPLVAGAEVVTGLQSIVSRNLGPEEWGVVSITEFKTDGARNIISSNVIIKGDVRALDPAVQEKIETRMREIVAGIADGYRIDASVDYSHEFIVLSNSKPETNAAVKAAKATVGAPMVDGNCDVAACSEDFAQFLAKVPGCFILMGVGEGAAQLHNPHYDYEDETLVVGASYWVNLTLQQLAQ